MPDIIVNNKSFRDIELILFDKDGTLIDIHHYWVSMIKLRARLLVDRYFGGSNDKVEGHLVDLMGVDIQADKMKPDGPVGVKPRELIVDIVTQFLIENKVNVNSSEVELLFKEVDKATEDDILPLLKLLPNIKGLLQSLKDCHVKMAIVSTDMTHRAIAAMKALELDGFFNMIIGGDKVKKAKPSPDLALHVMRQLNVTADNVLVIGDHPVDVKMATAAQIFANVGVLTGISNTDDFLGEDVEVIDNLNFVDVKC